MAEPSRRAFLAGVGGLSLGLAGCLGAPFAGTGGRADLTVFVGAYHWGFVLLDADGAEHERLVVDPGTRIELVAFDTEADRAVAELPSTVRSALPDHETLEERNEERIPSPPGGDLHAAIEEANERYRDHSLAVMPSGFNRGPGMMDGGMGGPMGRGMMLHPIPITHDAPRPATAGLVANERGDYTLSCLTYCGYGHPYMELDGGFVVR